MEREQLRAESTLVVTVKLSAESHSDVIDGIEALEWGVRTIPSQRSRSRAMETS
jgi:predicted transcriptional regulator